MENNPFQEIADRSAKKTDDKFAAEIDALVKPSREALEKLFPTPADRAKLSELIQITKKSTDEMELLSRIKDGASGLGMAAIKLLKSVILA